MRLNIKRFNWIILFYLIIPLPGSSFDSLISANRLAINNSELPIDGKLVDIHSNIIFDFPYRLSPEQANVIAGYPRLRVGITIHSIVAPLFLYRWDEKLDGIYADYIHIVSAMLKVPIDLKIFSTQELAENALINGDIQLLANSSTLILSAKENGIKPILVQPLAMLIRKEHSNDADDKMNILAPSDSSAVLLQTLRQHYRTVEKATCKNQAIQAVADGVWDAYIEGRSQIAGILAFHPFLELTSRRIEQVGPLQYYFTGRKESELVNVINQVINDIPHTIKNEIYERWISGLPLTNNYNSAMFTASEKEWIADHPIINVAVNIYAPPYSFKDKNGQITGIDIDILRLIGEKSGLQFNFIPAEGVIAVGELLTTGKAQMSTESVDITDNKNSVVYSTPYGTLEWVMITRNERSAPQNLGQLTHRRVAIPKGMLLSDVIKSYPKTSVIEVDNVLDGVNMVLAGAADATFDNLISANYLQASRYGKKIIIHLLENAREPERYSVSLHFPEFVNILDKSIEHLPPNELRTLRLKWLSMMSLDTYNGNKISPWAMVWGAVLLVIALSSVFWGSYLAHQVRRRKLAEIQLKNSLAYWETLFNIVPTPMFVCDPSMKITAGNLHFWREMNPQSHVSAENNLFSLNFLRQEDKKEIITVFLNCLSGAPAYFSDRQIIIQGQQKDVYLWFESYNDAEGCPQGIIGGWFDITDRKALSRELRLERDKAEDASQEKSNFLARMSHEIRTPMHAIIGILDLAVKQQIAPNSPLNIAYNSAKSLQGVIGDILDFSKIEAGKMGLVRQPASLEEALQASLATFQHRAVEKGLTLQATLNLPCGQNHFFDVTRVTQIVNNLLSNAIKFTEFGGIKISADYCHDELIDVDNITLSIIDSGCGVPELMREAILQPYVQVLEANTNQTGTGLGLPISAQLIELMGGKLTIHSVPTGGTQVDVTLPLQRVMASEKVTEQVPEEIESLRILVVDDLQANLTVISLQLTPLGHQITLAHSGQEALALVEHHYFDMVLTDCQMPLMNGYELAQNIRQREKRRQSPPMAILGCTANAFSTEEARCLDAGMDGVLIKPFIQSKLATEITQHYQHKNGGKELNYQEVEALSQHDRATEINLLTAVLQGAEEDIAALNCPTTAQDRLSVQKHAHRLKGSFSLLGYQMGERVCLRAENSEEPYFSDLVALIIVRTSEFNQQIQQRLAMLEKSIDKEILPDLITRL